MQEKLIDGKAIARKIKTELKEEIEELKAQGITPGLTAVLVGDDPASHIYVNNKAKACKKTGINGEVIKLPKETKAEELAKIIAELNARDDVHGILIQSPLPKHIDELGMILNVDPLKDVDGFHPMNIGYMLLGSPIFLACTPFGVIRILDDIGVDPKGKKVVILGRGNIVGKPLAAMMMQKWEGCNATVTVCHTGTSNIIDETKQADIIVAAMGMPKFVTGDMIKEGAVVIDVGVNRVDDPSKKKGYYLCGDVDFDSCLEKVSKITPVPGGVGPITIAMLLYNTVRAAKLKLVNQQ
ncbi:MAG: bifunctional 5,10-methylenetetrahydrofolate dehydrogenase/5,10-methenyltetrahydrofolate cyclohydrolase [candidate division Zixibacteria bacterium]|nr:bifunctional 5,10-methylenetetrahydrofolate dehydrogenase/5,10-methenyltetrahydrofolate cyclohydrolase [candidate division Zixibacteria bacterium]